MSCLQISFYISVSTVVCILLSLNTTHALSINVTASSEEDSREVRARVKNFNIYNHQMIDMNGTIRKYFAVEGLLREPSNIVLSPLAAMLPIGKLYFGAGSESKREIENAFGLGYADEIKRVLFNAISNMQKLEGIQLNIALFMLLPKYTEVKSEYKEKISQLFHFNLQYVNFAHKTQVADYTNYMLKVLTGGVTDKIVDPSEIESNSSLVVFNTCVFKGDWESPFEKVNNFIFTTGYLEKKKIDAYRVTSTTNYYSDELLKAELVSINFKAKKASLLIVLPFQSSSLDKVLNTIKEDPILLQNAMSNMSLTVVQITVPKFQVETKADLKNLYMKVGVKKIFNSQDPGLTKLLVHGTPWVTSVRQLIKFRLRNMWVAGSADNGGIMSFNSSSEPRKNFDVSKFFNANRPFLFYILHRGEQLFVGTIYDP